MSRNHDFSKLTEAQLEEISKDYPDAVKTMRIPVYKRLSMLVLSNSLLSSGKRIGDLLAETAAQNKAASESIIEDVTRQKKGRL